MNEWIIIFSFNRQTECLFIQEYQKFQCSNTELRHDLRQLTETRNRLLHQLTSLCQRCASLTSPLPTTDTHVCDDWQRIYHLGSHLSAGQRIWQLDNVYLPGWQMQRMHYLGNASMHHPDNASTALTTLWWRNYARIFYHYGNCTGLLINIKVMLYANHLLNRSGARTWPISFLSSIPLIFTTDSNSCMIFRASISIFLSLILLTMTTTSK